MTAFTITKFGEKRSRNGEYPSGRSCLYCGVEGKKFSPGTVLIIAGQSHPKVFCGLCSIIQLFFCSKCLSCAAWFARTNAFRISWSQNVGEVLCRAHLLRQIGGGLASVARVLRDPFGWLYSSVLLITSRSIVDSVRAAVAPARRAHGSNVKSVHMICWFMGYGEACFWVLCLPCRSRLHHDCRFRSLFSLRPSVGGVGNSRA